MIIIAKDVTDPGLYSNPPTVHPFAIADHEITNGNGSKSYVAADGTVIGQEPMQYGVRHDAPNVDGMGVYQMFTREGAILTVQTRPQDPMFVYTIAEGQAF